jgi:hypothetical protein
VSYCDVSRDGRAAVGVAILMNETRRKGFIAIQVSKRIITIRVKRDRVSQQDRRNPRTVLGTTGITT